MIIMCFRITSPQTFASPTAELSGTNGTRATSSHAFFCSYERLVGTLLRGGVNGCYALSHHLVHHPLLLCVVSRHEVFASIYHRSLGRLRSELFRHIGRLPAIIMLLLSRSFKLFFQRQGCFPHIRIIAEPLYHPPHPFIGARLARGDLTWFRRSRVLAEVDFRSLGRDSQQVSSVPHVRRFSCAELHQPV